MAIPVQTPRTFNPEIDGLLWGWQWNSTQFTFRFPQSAVEFTATGYADVQGFVPFNAQQQQQIILAIQNLTAFIPATLQPAAIGTDPTFRFAQAAAINYPNPQGLHIPGGRGSAEAAVPDPDLIPSHAWGDQWFTTGEYDTPVIGNFQNAAGLLHEFGHALGLKHGHATQPANGQVHPALPADKDNQNYSIMTYAVYPGDDPFNRTEAQDMNPLSTVDYPWTFQQLDIQALQYMYGANFNANSGNTVYTFNKDTGALTIVDGQNPAFSTGPSKDAKIFLTIWDGGGFDTYDLRNYTDNMVVDLRPGAFSTFSQAQLAKMGQSVFAKGNIANALLYNNDPRSLIEGVWAGSGNDVLVGNTANNVLAGYDGNDILAGLQGADDYYGYGTGNDIYEIDNPGDRVLFEQEGNDTILASITVSLANYANVENVTLTGAAALNATGTGVANSLVGNSAANTLIALAGSDVLDGKGGNDLLDGGTGSDAAVYAGARAAFALRAFASGDGASSRR